MSALQHTPQAFASPTVTHAFVSVFVFPLHSIAPFTPEPLVGTKKAGKGTAQRLAPAHGVVVMKHHVKILLTTGIGKSTTLYINLPFKPEGAEKE